MPNHVRAHHYFRRLAKKDPFDYVVYFFMIATPLFEVPQLVTIYGTHSSAGVSLWTWGFFMISSAVWVVYSLRKKLTTVLTTNLLFFVIELTIVAGIFIYPHS